MIEFSPPVIQLNLLDIMALFVPAIQEKQVLPINPKPALFKLHSPPIIEENYYLPCYNNHL